MNNFLLVGKYVGELPRTEEELNYIRIAVTRPFKNDEGMYLTDFLKLLYQKQ